MKRFFSLPLFFVLFLLNSFSSDCFAVDTTAPNARITNLLANENIRGTITVEVAAVDEVGGSGLSFVEFLVDGKEFGRSEEWPGDRVYFEWNTKYVNDGVRELSVRVVDRSGNEYRSNFLRVRVDNHGAYLAKIISPSEVALTAQTKPGDILPPWVAMAGPNDGKIMRGTIPLEAFATDEAYYGAGVNRVEFFEGLGAGRMWIGAATASGVRYTFNWNAAVFNGVQWISAEARDGSGKISVSTPPVRIQLDNQAPTVLDVRVRPQAVRNDTVTVYVFFRDRESYMDESVQPQVTLNLPGGGARAVTQTEYYGERGLWIGTVDVDSRTADGVGTATVDVANAADKAGNVMAAAPRAGYVQLAAANPRRIVADNNVMNDFGIGYFISATHSRVHEGIDYVEPVGTNVTAARAGSVVHVDGAAAGTNRTVTVRVTVGQTAAGAAIFEYDGYLHMTNIQVAVGAAVVPGTYLGDVGNNYPAGYNHTHFMIGGIPNGPGYPWAGAVPPQGYPYPPKNPLFFVYKEYRNFDPGEVDPALTEGAADNRTIYALRMADNTVFNTPTVPVYGPLTLLGEFADSMNHFSRVAPLETGYWIEPLQTLSWGARNERAPYLLSHWMDYEIVIDTIPDIDRYVTRNYTTTWQDAAGNNFPWQKYHHAILSNAGALNGRDNDRNANQYWYTRARLVAGKRDNGSYNLTIPGGGAAPVPADAAARINSEALFKDGNYRLHLMTSDINRRLIDAGQQVILVDNFAPHTVYLNLTQGTLPKRLRYKANWELDAAGTGQSLLPAAQNDRNPRWVNRESDLVVNAVFSEPADGRPSVLLQKNGGGEKSFSMDAAALTRDQAWQATIPSSDADFKDHKFDNAAGRRMAFQFNDLARNTIDSNPATIGLRTEATGVWGGYENAANPGWGGKVVDENYMVRIDTKHDQKPVAPTSL